MDTRGRGFGEPLEDGKNISELTLWDTDAYAGAWEAALAVQGLPSRCPTQLRDRFLHPGKISEDALWDSLNRVHYRLFSPSA